MGQIRMIVFDIDGVITDGKRYTNGKSEMKSLSMKDLDAIGQIRESGYKVGCISGEDTEFSRGFVRIACIEPARLGCKKKDSALAEMAGQCGFLLEEICYIGDGKYDIPALEMAGLALCPADATDEVKQVADVILTRRGGDGCIAECHTLLEKLCREDRDSSEQKRTDLVVQRMNEHLSTLNKLMGQGDHMSRIVESVEMIVDCYRKHGKVLICGNGGSAADAQHLVGELVGRFYLERQALNAEALSTNTSVLTALANDYDYDMIFARQVEAKAIKGDVLIGITTSGTSRNIQRAFQVAKQRGARTVLLTGDITEKAKILEDTDCLLAVPAKDTPRVQEMHILMGHIICELVEREIAENIQ